MKVMLADGHALVRQGIRSLLNGVAGVDVVGEACDGTSLVAVARGCRPDVIVTEIDLPHLNGILAAGQVVSEGLPCQILFLSSHSDRDSIARAFDSGARGYVLKETDFKYVVAGIRAVHQHETYLGPKVFEILAPISMPAETKSDAPVQLTCREREVLRLVAEGQNSKDIAFSLGITNKTVDTFRRRCMQKLQLKSNADLTKYALRHGMITL